MLINLSSFFLFVVVLFLVFFVLLKLTFLFLFLSILVRINYISFELSRWVILLGTCIYVRGIVVWDLQAALILGDTDWRLAHDLVQRILISATVITPIVDHGLEFPEIALPSGAILILLTLNHLFALRLILSLLLWNHQGSSPWSWSTWTRRKKVRLVYHLPLLLHE